MELSQETYIIFLVAVVQYTNDILDRYEPMRQQQQSVQVRAWRDWLWQCVQVRVWRDDSDSACRYEPDETTLTVRAGSQVRC